MSEFLNRMGGAAQAGTDGTPLEQVLSQLMGGHRDGAGLNNLVDRLRQGGLGPEADSWVSDGPNQPVDPQRLEQAIGPEEAQRLAQSAGIPQSGLMSVLAMFLPQLVNHFTPSGQLPPPSGSGGMLGGLGGLLGGAMGPGAAPMSSGGMGGGLGGILGGLFGGLMGGGQQQPDPRASPGYAQEEAPSSGGLGGLLGGLFGGGGASQGGGGSPQLSDHWEQLTRRR